MGGFAGGDVDGRDAWQVQPGMPGSLARVTGYLP